MYDTVTMALLFEQNLMSHPVDSEKWTADPSLIKVTRVGKQIVTQNPCKVQGKVKSQFKIAIWVPLNTSVS